MENIYIRIQKKRKRYKISHNNFYTNYMLIIHFKYIELDEIYC